MAYEFITYRVADRIAYVTINRPQVMNALHPAANAEMLDAFTSFRDDDDAWIAILTGAGDRAFSAWQRPARDGRAHRPRGAAGGRGGGGAGRDHRRLRVRQADHRRRSTGTRSAAASSWPWRAT